MEYSVKFYEQLFTAAKSKDAYLKVCKWIANNLIAKANYIGETSYKISKVSQTDEATTFKLELFCSLNLDEDVSKYCVLCKEMHCQFYINEEYNCNRCNMLNLYKRMQSKLKIKQQYRKELIEDIGMAKPDKQ